MSVRGATLWTKTPDKSKRAGLPESVVRRMSGQPPETTQKITHTHTHTHTASPRLEMKIPDPATNRIRSRRVGRQGFQISPQRWT